MWSDPDENKSSQGWTISPRGCGWLHAEDVVDRFLLTNNLQLIARAHQLVQEGYKVIFKNSFATVWSAPNYCYRCGNVASILEFDSHLNRNFRTFDAAPEGERRIPEPLPAPEYFL